MTDLVPLFNCTRRSAPRFASRSATSGSPCRKPIPTARSSPPLCATSKPFLCAAEDRPDRPPPKRNRSIAQAEVCLNASRHALPNPKNDPFTVVHTTESLDPDRIDIETLRKPFRSAKITFISEPVTYAG